MVPRYAAVAIALGVCCQTGLAASIASRSGPSDPGVTEGPSNAGGPLGDLSAAETERFFAGWQLFKSTYSVSGTIESGAGLGPSFNGLGCAECHAQPAAGGASSGPQSPQVRRIVLREHRLTLTAMPNPQVSLGDLHRVPGGKQPAPPFITANGPVRVARFIRHADGTLDGDVHAIYTIAGRIDAPQCDLRQPDFPREVARNNVVFRVPLPTFGDGLVEAIPDASLEAAMASSRAQREALGIRGRFRAADGKIARFGWKAQGKSLFLFSAEAQNVEIGATNEVYPTKRHSTDRCSASLHTTASSSAVASALPPSSDGANASSGDAAPRPSDVASLVDFLSLLAPPKPSTHTRDELEGARLFTKVGCAYCHTPTQATGPSKIPSLDRKIIHPYSDFALHHMGPTLADHISQGVASGDEFRTPPLWGLGQRIFFLHDGRASDLVAAIAAHASTQADCKTHREYKTEACASEANAVVARFNAMGVAERQALIDFLRSL